MKHPIGSHLTKRETQPISQLYQFIVLHIWACVEVLLSEATNTAYGYIGCFCSPTPPGVGGLKSVVRALTKSADPVPPHPGWDWNYIVHVRTLNNTYHPAGTGTAYCIATPYGNRIEANAK